MNRIKFSGIVLVGVFSAFILACSGNGEDTAYDETQEDYLPDAPDYETYSAEMKDLENRILVSFAGYYPDDAASPDYLLKAADYALALGQPEKSVKILTRIIDEYPNYDRMESVMFNKASHQDFELRDTTNAKNSYREFIAKFPNSDLVDDAKNRIENISLTLDELADKFIKEMESKPQ